MDGLGHMYRELLGRSPLAKVIAGLFGLIVGGGITVRLWIGGGVTSLDPIRGLLQLEVLEVHPKEPIADVSPLVRGRRLS